MYTLSIKDFAASLIELLLGQVASHLSCMTQYMDYDFQQESFEWLQYNEESPPFRHNSK